MDGSVNASLDSKARYVYRQSRRTSVWRFVARAATRERERGRGRGTSRRLNVRRDADILAFKGTAAFDGSLRERGSESRESPR